MVVFIDTPLGRVSVPEPLLHGTEVDHVLINPLTDRINLQLLASTDGGLVVVASATLKRPVAASLLLAIAAGLEDPRPEAATMIVA